MIEKKLKNLNDADLTKKHQKVETISKIIASIFAVSLLIAIGYAGYAQGKGLEEPLSYLKSEGVAFLGSLTVIFYYLSSRFKEELTLREK